MKQVLGKDGCNHRLIECEHKTDAHKPRPDALTRPPVDHTEEKKHGIVLVCVNALMHVRFVSEAE